MIYFHSDPLFADSKKSEQFQDVRKRGNRSAFPVYFQQQTFAHVDIIANQNASHHRDAEATKSLRYLCVSVVYRARKTLTPLEAVH